MREVIFTIGHSTHSIDTFLDLLVLHGISAICDVRSSPYSRFKPQYNREKLRKSLRGRSIKYVFLGKELGAQSKDSSCYCDGRVQYHALARTELFRSGIERICMGVKRGYRMALMCAERDPLDCHRTILVAQNLERDSFSVSHILSDGTLETHNEVTARLTKELNFHHDDLFLSTQDVIDRAFRKQEEKISYTKDSIASQATKKVI